MLIWVEVEEDEVNKEGVGEGTYIEEVRKEAVVVSDWLSETSGGMEKEKILINLWWSCSMGVGMTKEKLESCGEVGDLYRRSRRLAIDASVVKLSVILLAETPEMASRRVIGGATKRGNLAKFCPSPVQQILDDEGCKPM